MKAAVYEKLGPPEVMEVREIEKPTPGKGEVLVKVRFAAINPFDWKMRGALPLIRIIGNLGKKRVRRAGGDFAGVVEAAGKNVTRFKKGDAVFGFHRGACAEYLAAPQEKAAKKPNTVTFEQAAAVPVAAMTALQGLRDKGGIGKGDRVLIYGASGGVGHFAVQIAKAFGAKVTAVCSTANLKWVKALGADQVIDYTKEDFTERGEKYDIIFDTVGYARYFKSRRCLSGRGVFIAANFFNKAQDLIAAPVGFLSRRKGARIFITRASRTDLKFLAELLAKKKLKPRIDRCFRLDQIIAAHRYGERGHTRGKVVIKVANG